MTHCIRFVGCRFAADKHVYCDCSVLRMSTDKCDYVAGPMELHPGPAIAALMKLSFDEQHRQAICSLGQYHHGTVASFSVYEHLNLC